MPDPGPTLQWWATLGIGGVLAGFMFMFYRKDIRQFTELWKTTAEMLVITIKDNTAALTKLIGMLESVERNTMRKSDVEEIVDKRFLRDKP